MVSRKDIIDIIYSFHTDGKEKLVVIQDMAVSSFEKRDFLEKVKGYMSFFRKHLSGHFRNESAMIGLLEKSGEVTKGESDLYTEILHEHEVFMNDFNTLKKVMERPVPEDAKFRKRVFEIINGLTAGILKHAEMEDNSLYEIARKKLSPEQKKQLEENIKKQEG